MSSEPDIFGVLNSVEPETMESSDASTPYRVLITGSRDFAPYEFIETVLDESLVARVESGIKTLKYDHIVIVHGGARGADSLAGRWATETKVSDGQSITVETHPAEWNLYGRGAGHIRNKKMVDLGADVCIAFPLAEGKSAGTRGCMKVASYSGIVVIDATRLHWESFNS